VALVRVYCGLASAYPPRRLAVGSSSLTATIVDDGGRVLDVCDIGDDAYGYAYLSASLAERATGPYSVAIAADNDQQLVTRLLVAAGWALAIVDHESTDEFAERFTDEFADQQQSSPTQRRALGLARALQGGVISANLLPVASELAEVKPVLAAHSALATGRHAAAVALREVLRELYPAALRAYPDPADPVALSVIEVVPEPGLLGSATSRGRDAAAIVDSITQTVTQSGVADAGTVGEAVTALRVAIAETPRRNGVSRTLTGTVADTVRQAVAAVRACDAATTSLVNSLVERTSALAASQPRPTATRSPSSPLVPGQRAAARAQRGAAEPASTHSGAGLGGGSAIRGGDAAAAAAGFAARANHVASAPPGGETGQAHNRPVSPPPPPPPGITPIREPQPGGRAARRSAERSEQDPRVPTARPAPDHGPRGSRNEWPTNPPADDWASGSSGSDWAASSSIGDQWSSGSTGGGWSTGGAASDPLGEGPAVSYGGSSDGYGGNGDGYGGYGGANGCPSTPSGAYGADSWRGGADREPSGGWRSDHSPLGDLPGTSDSSLPPANPGEPPMLRLVEPTLPEELRGELGYASSGNGADSPPLRLVENAGVNGAPRSVPPVSADDDDNLLIFAQTRSAWFDQDPAASWTSAMDLGWQAAEQASQPTIGERTGAGLPRRVPHANLVPGAPPRREERPLRVVRDPASIAAHTSGYFSGWRKGQEIGGFPLGNRPARRAAGAWEFHRDEDRLSG
jgi:hypothetical protein